VWLLGATLPVHRRRTAARSGPGGRSAAVRIEGGSLGSEEAAEALATRRGTGKAGPQAAHIRPEPGERAPADGLGTLAGDRTGVGRSRQTGHEGGRDEDGNEAAQ